MRISTNTLFDTSTSKLSDLQARMMQTQQQISTGRRLLTPADDPVAAARAYDVTQARSVNTQYATNRQNVKSSLGLEEGVLQNVTTLLQDIKTSLVAAGNAAFSDTERKYLATELKERFQQMLGLANSDDGSGGYLFAGYQSDTQPFAQTSTGAVYNGDQGQRMLQVSASRQLAQGDNGNKIFEQIRTGNGTFSISAGAGNTGTGVFSPGTVTNSALVTGDNYSVTFTVTGGVTTYDIIDTTTATTISAGNAYTSGNAISFAGMQFEVKGDPANGDSFAIAPSTNQSVFTTLKNAIDLLESSSGGSLGQTRLANGLSIANSNLDNALDNVLTVRAELGSRLREIDTLNSTGEDIDLQYAENLRELQDLDYTKAISSLVQQQTTLTAAQQSFVKLSGLSLFNFL